MKMVMPGSKAREGARRALARAAVAAAVAVLTLPGCLILGRRQTDQPISPQAVSRVQTGMTKNQVTDILGAPQEIIFSNKEHDPLREHAYIYEHPVEAGTAIFFGVVNFGNLDQKKDRAIIFFGEDGRVANVARSLYADQASYGFPFGR